MVDKLEEVTAAVTHDDHVLALVDCWMFCQSDVKRKASVDGFLLTDKDDLKTSKM